MLHRVAPYSMTTLPGGFARMAGLIGETPTLSLTLRRKGRGGVRIHRILAKRECGNLSGSIKDRMAWEVLAGGYARGELKAGDRIVEATSGNAGIALAALGRALGHPVTIFMPDWMSEERKAILRGFGAELRLVSREEGGFLGSIAMAEAMGREADTFLPRQFSNPDNVRAHARTTGPELAQAFQRVGQEPSAFVAGVGTGGTVMGAGRSLSRLYPALRVHPVEPAESPTLSTGHKVGAHRIQGVSDDFIPDIVKLDALAPVISVSDGDAILMAQKLAREAGMGVGISSGANVIAALLAAPEDPEDARPVCTVLADCAQKYLSTDLAREEPVRDGYLTPEVDLLDVEVV